MKRFDCVVIGSGFGGAVSAWRMQKESPGCSVLLLERGMPYPPGSFPRRPSEVRGTFWEPDSELFGLYEVWSFEHSKVLVSSGLGGGSLIYANVMLEKPDSTFSFCDEHGSARRWPIEPADLEQGYEVTREKLGATTLPEEYHDPVRGTPLVPKTRQFRDAARRAGVADVRLANLAITFAGSRGVEQGARIEGENLHGRPRRTCTLSGECDAGCNEGAKNSLDFNFLSEFSLEYGGTIRTCCEAVALKPCTDGEYEVRYLQHLEARERVLARANDDTQAARDRALLHPESVPEEIVKAGVVVVAAGALGSPGLLLRSRPYLPQLSGRLGSGFSSNGDELLLVRECEFPGGAPRELAPSRGPTITAYATTGHGEDSLWLEDAGGPVLSEWGWQLPASAARLPAFAWRLGVSRLARRLRGEGTEGRVGGDLSDALGETTASNSMLPMLGMGIDVPGGRLRLDRSGLAQSWDPASSREHFGRVEELADKVGAELGGKRWPRSAGVREQLRGVTVHPLGGCAMAARAADGVVDPFGEVFGYEGLFVADGSVMPGPVGPNPSLTIAAIAHRVAGAAGARMRERSPAAGSVGA